MELEIQDKRVAKITRIEDLIPKDIFIYEGFFYIVFNSKLETNGDNFCVQLSTGITSRFGAKTEVVKIKAATLIIEE